MKISSKLVITLALLILIAETLSAIKLISNREPEDDIPSREATQEEKIIEENQEEVPEEEPEEPLPIPELPEQEPEEPEILLSPQEETRVELVEKYGEVVVNAWEKLTVDPNFNFVGKRITVKEFYGPEGEVNYECYITTENGNEEWAGVGGNYYVYGTFISDEAIFDLVEYHNMFSVEN
jgi:hypothetical protein